MAAELRVAVDVGSRFHQVAIGTTGGELIDEFRIDHQQAGFSCFFERIEQHGLEDIRVAMEGYNGWARPLDQQVLARGWRLYNVNNLKLARYKEIFPAPVKTDAIDARRMLELFAFDGAREKSTGMNSAFRGVIDLSRLVRRLSTAVLFATSLCRTPVLTAPKPRLPRMRDLQAGCFRRTRSRTSFPTAMRWRLRKSGRRA